MGLNYVRKQHVSDTPNSLPVTSSPQRILVVDDEPDVTDLLVKVLNGSGFEAHAVNSPLKVLQRAIEVHPDLIILDFVMPQLLGPEIALLLKSNAATRNVPVMFLSGMTDEDHRLIGMMSGAVAYLEKPVNPLTLIETVRAQLRKAP